MPTHFWRQVQKQIRSIPSNQTGGYDFLPLFLRIKDLTGATVNGINVPSATTALNEWSLVDFDETPGGAVFNRSSFFISIDNRRVQQKGFIFDVVLLHELGHASEALFFPNETVNSLVSETKAFTQRGHLKTSKIEAGIIDKWEDPYREERGLPYRTE